jgi:hypothetical protein
MDLVYFVEPQVDRKQTESRRNYAINTFLGLRFYTAVELGFSPRFSMKAGMVNYEIVIADARHLRDLENRDRAHGGAR